jgi:hypothetical protein
MLSSRMTVLVQEVLEVDPLHVYSWPTYNLLFSSYEEGGSSISFVTTNFFAMLGGGNFF